MGHNLNQVVATLQSLQYTYYCNDAMFFSIFFCHIVIKLLEKKHAYLLSSLARKRKWSDFWPLLTATATMYQAVLQQTTWIVNLVNIFLFIPEKAGDSFKAMFFTWSFFKRLFLSFFTNPKAIKTDVHSKECHRDKF